MGSFYRRGLVALAIVVGGLVTPTLGSAPASAVGTGGTLAYTSFFNFIYAIHTFTADGTFTTPSTVPEGSTISVQYVIVGGGGGGGNYLTGPVSAGAGGGGGGGYLTGTVTLNPGTAYTITVGAGGAAGANGESSTFDGLTAVGGGAGASVNSGGATSGGSGGGGSCDFSTGAAGTPGPPVQGYSGGNAVSCGTSLAGAGGGGTKTAGSNLSSPNYYATNGGQGVAPTISGSAVIYGGGGGGGISPLGGQAATLGGTNAASGAGNGATGPLAALNVAATSGLANRGGGGGGASVAWPTGGSGGSGVVILRYQVYTLTYNGNGSTSGTAPTAVTHLASKEATPVAGSANLVKTGYAFIGWNTAAAGTGTSYSPGSSIGITANTTLYAQWGYSVAFDPNGGTGTMGDEPFAYGQTKPLTTHSFTRPGYQFAGWNTAADGSGTPYSDAQSVKDITTTANPVVTLYAQWQPNAYSVAFDPNGGTGTMADEGIAYGQTVPLTPNAFTRTGYRFSGWNTAADGSGTPYADLANVTNLSLVNGAAITLFAQWQPYAYRVIFDPNGGAGAMADQTFAYDQSQSLTANSFSRRGYHFAGWNTAADGSGMAYADAVSIENLSVEDGSAVRLFAQWEPDRLARGGSGSSPGGSSGPGQGGPGPDIGAIPGGNSHSPGQDRSGGAALPDTGGPQVWLLGAAVALIASGSFLVRGRVRRSSSL